MESTLLFMFGEGTELTLWQMAFRTVAVFVIAIFLIRVSGRRSFGLHSPFDSCTTVLLGAVLSRAVVGASPFWATVGAATALVIMHRATARASANWEWFERLVSGHARELVAHGHINAIEMRKGLITRKDLEEAMRKKSGIDDIAAVERAVLERNGDITIEKKK